MKVCIVLYYFLHLYCSGFYCQFSLQYNFHGFILQILYTFWCVSPFHIHWCIIYLNEQICFGLVEKKIITISISVIVISLFIFSISSWFTLGRLCFSKNCPFLLGPFYWHIVVYSSLMILHISGLFVATFPLLFLILLIYFIPFFLLNLANNLSILFILSKSHLLVLLIIAIGSIYFSSISFLLLTLVFSYFSSCFRCKIRLFIQYFSCCLK